MKRIRLFTTSTCGYCALAKRLLTQRGLDYDEVDVTDDDAERARLVDLTGQRTVPQIFIDGEPIGGYQELAALDRTGELARRVALS